MYLKKNEFSKVVGKTIRELRLSKKRSIESLSDELGIGYSQLSRIENGKINTSIYHIYIILKALDIQKIAPLKPLLSVLIKTDNLKEEEPS